MLPDIRLRQGNFPWGDGNDNPVKSDVGGSSDHAQLPAIKH
jgi:hypothetical protein